MGKNAGNTGIWVIMAGYTVYSYAILLPILAFDQWQNISHEQLSPLPSAEPAAAASDE